MLDAWLYATKVVKNVVLIIHKGLELFLLAAGGWYEVSGKWEMGNGTRRCDNPMSIFKFSLGP